MRKIATTSKPFTDGEFTKECMESAAEMLCPSQKHLFTSVSLSGITVARRIEELSEDIEIHLKDSSEFVFCSIALDEGSEITDTAQLAIVIRGIVDDFNITEEMAVPFPVNGTTKTKIFSML
jgi:hypothetical protein